MSNKKYNKSTIDSINELIADETMTMNACAVKLGIPLTSFKRICTTHGLIYTPRKHLQSRKITLHSNEFLNKKSQDALDAIVIDGNGSRITSSKLKAKLLHHGYLRNECSSCGLTSEWNGRSIVLQLDHIDGNNKNNLLGNLRILCPNCHSQTHTYCRSKGNRGNRANYDRLESIIDEHKPDSICAVAKLLGITPAAANYSKILRELSSRHIQSKFGKVCSVCEVPISNNAKTGKCAACAHIDQRRCNRPSKDELITELKSSNPFAMGRKYGVSDQAVRKWMRGYGIPTKKSEIKLYLSTIE